MSIDYEQHRRRYRVRWREEHRQRSRRFKTQEEAGRFASSVSGPPAQPPLEEPTAPDCGGVYAYKTSEGRRWRFAFRQSDRSLTTRRGFASRTAAQAARAAAIEEVRRGGVVVSRGTFADFWAQLRETKRPYVTAETLQDYKTHGRKRLLPWFGDLRLAAIDEDRVRDWIGDMSELITDGELSPKTVNNARTCLSMALGEAVRRRHLPRIRAATCPSSPSNAPRSTTCAPTRSSATARSPSSSSAPALASPRTDLDPDTGVVRIARQRAREGNGTTQTKGKRFRSIQVGPRLVTTLRSVHHGRRRSGQTDDGWVFLCPTPRRGRYASRTHPVPPNRKTVHDWHEWALEDAGLRDMPLHALRHTAATLWLATPHPLIFVQRQLGPRSITTTEEHYGHLEASFVKRAAEKTEALVAGWTATKHLIPRAA